MKKVTEMKMENNLLHIETVTDVGSKDYKVNQWYKVNNPIKLLALQDFMTCEDISKALMMFDEVELDWGTKAEYFESDEDRIKRIEEIDNQIDQNTIYIEDFNQMQKAKRWNSVFRNKIGIIKDAGHMPKTMDKSDLINTFLSQANQINEGLKVRSDKIIIAQMIRWIKKQMGFKLAHTDEATQTFYYTNTVLASNCKNVIVMCYAITKTGDNYSVEFYYDYPTVSDMNDGYHMIWTKENYTKHPFFAKGGNFYTYTD